MANFLALQTQVGPFPKDHIFSREEFARLHPPAKGKDAKAYHTGLLDRLIAMKALEVTDTPVTGDTPVGPMNMDEKPETDMEIVKRQAIEQLVKAVPTGKN